MKSVCLKAVTHVCCLASVVLSSILFSLNPAWAHRIAVDNSQMGVYRALAQLIFQSYTKDDLDTAVTLGRILDRTWDRDEENGEGGLNKTNPNLLEQIDEAMDAFIKPIIHSDQTKPDPAAVEAAYKGYLNKLKAAD